MLGLSSNKINVIINGGKEMKRNKRIGLLMVIIILFSMTLPVVNASSNTSTNTKENKAVTNDTTKVKSTNVQNSSITDNSGTKKENGIENKEVVQQKSKATKSTNKETVDNTKQESSKNADDGIMTTSITEEDGIMPLAAGATQTIANGTYMIKSLLNTNKVLDIDGGSKNNNANLQIWSKANVSQQKFNITYLGNGYYTIQATHSKKVLDVVGAGKKNGTNVQQYGANGTDAQKWMIRKEKSGYYSIVSKCNGLYLDVASGSTKDGTNVQMYKANGTKSQLFVFEKIEPPTKTIENGTYVIKSALNTNKVVDIYAGSTSNGANVQLYTRNDSNAQKFNINYLGNGYYTIQCVSSKKMLDVYAAGKANGTNVAQYGANGTDAQKWVIKKESNGSYSIISKCNNLYLDVAAGSTKDGTNLQMYQGNGTKSQLFTFEKTTVVQQTIKDGMYKIKSAKDTSKVVTVANGSTANSANIELSTDKNNKYQKFHVTHLGSGYYSIRAVHTKLSLDVKGSSTMNGTNVLQYTYTGGNNQKWIIKDCGNGRYNIISKCNNLCLDVAAGETKDGTNIQMYGANGTDAQKFIFEATSAQALDNGMYEIQSALDANKILDVSGGSTANNANVQIWSRANVEQQKFQVTHLGSNYYTIQAVHSKKVLDVAGAGKNNGTNVQQYAGNSSDAQKWLLKDLGDGTYSIISKCNNLYLDVAGGTTKDGTNVQMYKGNNTASQKFRFVKTTPVGTSNFSGLNESKYPGYKALLQKVQSQHPNWIITVKYTGLDWNTVINNEDQVVNGSPKSLTQYGNQWKNGNTQYGTGWYRASKAAIAYMMDPRNSLDEGYIFQFQNLTSTAGTRTDISKMLAGSFLTKYSSYSTDSIIDAIISSSKANSVSPFHIVSRMLQEQGTNGSVLNGYTYNGRQVYNLFNIGATGNSDAEIIKNGAEYAYAHHWFTPQACINGSVSFLSTDYFKKGQTTLYFQKYNVVDKNNLYNHQYMQNIRAANDEGKRISDEYRRNGLLGLQFEFVIPVYENMPAKACPSPAR